TSFFPKIYNEDWLFLFGENGLRPTARTNGVAVQRPYDPYRDPMRARSEELGDTIAEGLMWLLDNNQPLTEANYSFWSNFLKNRRKFLEEVMGMVDGAPIVSATKARMIESLKAARGRSWVIDPELCVKFMDSWRNDRKRWC